MLCERVILLNISPEEAQRHIAERDINVNYAKLLGQRSLADGSQPFKRYYRGRLIDRPEEFLEQTYEANQFHGQDGLGRSMFGYSDWNQGRLEARNANGEVRGSYKYVDPNGENIVVSNGNRSKKKISTKI